MAAAGRVVERRLRNASGRKRCHVSNRSRQGGSCVGHGLEGRRMQEDERKGAEKAPAKLDGRRR